MESDLEDLNSPKPKKEEKLIPEMPTGPISQEAKYNIPQAPLRPPLSEAEIKTETKPPVPVLSVPPKVIPPVKLPEVSTKPLFRPTPTWIKIGVIALGIVLIVFAGLYGYWKIFIQGAIPTTPPSSTSTVPILPITPNASTTTPIKFFNKLPHKTVTIDLPSKASASLINALKSEAAVDEPIASVKQIQITYQGKPITVTEFTELMSIFTPKDFLANYETDFVFAYFRQKEGARPILILKTKNKTEAQNQMTNWESGTLPSDILPLFLNNYSLPSDLSAFKSYLFIGQPVHYLNIGIAFASLNYAIYDDFLIFTTSSAGMFVIMQDLTGQTVSLDYLKSLEASINKFVK